MKKWIKKINIFMCCLLLCFCSVVAKPKEVQALIGVDDLALATIGLMGLSLLGIGITENINENYDTYKKVALNTYNSMCDFVGQAWEDMCLSAYNTGQFALTQLNNVKSNIQEWYNSFASGNIIANWDSVANMCANTRILSSIDDVYNQMISMLPDYTWNRYEGADVSFKSQLKSTFDKYKSNNSHIALIKNKAIAYPQFYVIYTMSKSPIFSVNINVNNEVLGYDSSINNFVDITRISFPCIAHDGFSSYYGQITDLYDQCFYSSELNSYIYTNDLTFSVVYKGSRASRIDNKWVFNGSELPVKGQSPLDGFAKLNDMVKGLDGVLDLDPISIGALNGTFEITDTTITNFGTISTNVLDLSNVHDDTYTFPLTGTLENTLDDTHTMLFNPTLDEDITNVGDITVTYPQNPSIPTLKDVDKIENIDDLKFDWTTVFPFCIPFDFIKFLKVLCSDPITPEVNWNYDLVGFKGTLNLSLKDYNDVASLLRKMETFSFILFLIFKTRELIRG